jgi:hypothetical protein
MLRRAALVLALIAAATGAGCSSPCCVFDSRPIALGRAELGELVATLSVDDGDAAPALIDTAARISVLDGSPGRIVGHRLRLLAGGSTRAVLRDVTMVPGNLSPVGDTTVLSPVAVLGGDLLQDFAVEIGFGRPELVLWAAQPAPDDFLSQAGFAVLRVARRGAGSAEVLGGSYAFPPSLLALRACAAPAAFDPGAAPPERCCAGEDRTLATGTDLSLVLGTGYGPTVLARSAWRRLVSGMPTPPVTVSRPLHVASAPLPVAAEWSTLPRLALVDREADPTANPGACVELGRARRLQQVDIQQYLHPDAAACALECDRDPRNPGLAQSAAAYVELGAALAVAVIDDGEPFFQSLRNAVRPDGPEIDGILGAGALTGARLELDYRSQPARAIFSCETGAPPTTCRAVGRCPRLSGAGTHACYGLPAHGLPAMCDNPGAACR